uniref:Uncharacterized protein n=1 Tax=Anguilla anguilla TaxID=7936 RepID=A0A0E9TE64_ANGAN
MQATKANCIFIFNMKYCNVIFNRQCNNNVIADYIDKTKKVLHMAFWEICLACK